MDEQKKHKILIKAKDFFRKEIIEYHKKNTLALKNKKKFNINPFLINYLARFAFGSTDKLNMAKVLIYPRVLGTSINTTFGKRLQKFCCENFDNVNGSVTKGIDIEFIDCIDNRKKYCQIKSGPNCINNDDVETITNHFKKIKNIAKQNDIRDINPSTDFIVGVLYGDRSELSSSYKTLENDFVVSVGQEFWYKLTGDESFYNELIDSFVSVANEVDSTDLINEVIEELSEQL